MDRLKNLYEDSNSRSEIVKALNTLRKYDINSALLWSNIPQTKGFGKGDMESMGLAASYIQGFRDALNLAEDPFIKFKEKDNERQRK